MKNLSIGKRTALLIAAAWLVILLFAATAQFQINAVFQAANYGNANVVPSLKVLNQALNSFGQMRVLVYRHVLNTDDSQWVHLEGLINDALSSTKASLNKYEVEATSHDDQEQRLLSATRKLVAEYGVAIHSAIALSSQKRTTEAGDALAKTSQLADKVSDAIEALIAYNEQQGQYSSLVAVATKDKATHLSILMVVASLTAVFVLGTWIALTSKRRLAGNAKDNGPTGHAPPLPEQIATASEDLAATAEELATQAEQLQALMAYFKLNQTNEQSIPTPPRRRSALRLVTTPASVPPPSSPADLAGRQP